LEKDFQIVVGTTLAILEAFYMLVVILSLKIMLRVGYLLKIHIPEAYNKRWGKIRRFVFLLVFFLTARCIINILLQFRADYENLSRLFIYVIDFFQIACV
jgi:membrane protein CcdC involved in cytochrome C biogenesis